MKSAYLSLLAAAAATVSFAAGAVPSSTDEARAEAGKRIAAAEQTASLRPFVATDSETVTVTDSDSARRAAGQASARQAHDQHLAEVVRAGAGYKPAPIAVTDTDSARAAAGQSGRQQQLLADYADYLKMQAQAALESTGASKR